MTDANNSRAPQGFSIQKVKNGAWSEVFRDDQNSPLFVFEPGSPTLNSPATGLPMFDLRARVIGNTFDIQVMDHLGNIIDYPLITDSTDPILTGTVRLTTWV